MAKEDPKDPVNGGSRPVPDPTVLTTEALQREALALQREIAALRAYVDSQFQVRDERLSGIDTATSLRLQTLHEFPDAIVAAINHERELSNERFVSVSQRFGEVDKQFLERDTRSEKVENLNKVALDAAFAAQKEAAAKQDEANQKAIDKSEKATNETITKNADAAEARAKSQDEKIDDIKLRLGIIDGTLVGMLQRVAGSRENTSDKQSANGALYAAVGLGISLILVAIAIVGFLAARGK